MEKSTSLLATTMIIASSAVAALAGATADEAGRRAGFVVQSRRGL